MAYVIEKDCGKITVTTNWVPRDILRDHDLTEAEHADFYYVFLPGDTNEIAGYSLTLPAVTPMAAPRRSRRRIRRELLATLQIR
jgi:hypothetical protein